MKTMVVYDDEGVVLFSGQGSLREPVGVPFLWVEIPEGKRLKIVDGIGVNISATPHQATLEDVPPSEFDILDSRTKDLEMALSEILFGGM